MSELSTSLHPMTIRDILERSLRLYRSNFLKFIGIIILVKGPYLILASVLTQLMEFVFTNPGTDAVQMAAYKVAMTFFLIGILDLLFVGPILAAAMTTAISDRFLNQDIGVIGAYKKILRRFFPLLGAILLRLIVMLTVLFACVFLGMTMAVSGGALGLIIVMFGLALAGVLWIWYAFIPQTVIIEGEGGTTAMKRSKYLAKGYIAKAFILIILVLIGLVLIRELVSLGVGRAIVFLGGHGNLLAQGVSNVLSVLLEPFRIAVITLLYYDFRIRKEGFDLEVMAEELEADVNDGYII